MKIGKFVINILKRNSDKGAIKRRKAFPPYGLFKKERINIPYIDDNNPQHTFDVIYAEKNRKNAVIFDIHGGSYIFGEHKDNYIFMSKFVEQGYDAVIVDYQPNDGALSTMDLIQDIAKNFNYVFEHLKELELEGEDVIITGDSAGGHFALTMSELLLDKNYAAELGLSFPDVNLVACVVNCPVYNFAHLSENNLTRSGMKRLFGPTYNDQTMFEKLCPKIHLGSLTCPVFVSTCKKDFLRGQSLELANDMKDKPNPFELLDINSDDKMVGHVHNVLHPELPEGIQVNNAMMAFIEKNLKQ